MDSESISKEMGWWNPGGVALDNFEGFDAYPDRTKKVEQLITQSNRALIERIRSELPHKQLFSIDRKEFELFETSHQMKLAAFGAYRVGKSKVLDDVTAVLTVIEESVK